MAWEQDQHTSTPPRRATLDLYTVAVVLLLLTSLAAIAACFARMN